MISTSTDFLSWVVVMFALWVYVPSMLFRHYAELNVDLGRSRDETWFEEMIGEFLPGVILNVFAVLAAWGLHNIKMFKYYFSIELGVIASMFGQNRGAVSDYIYSSNWWYCVSYLALLWFFAFSFGWWFGRSAKRVCSTKAALEGIEYINDDGWRDVKQELWPKGTVWYKRLTGCLISLGWHIWHRFFHESIFPLYTWREFKGADTSQRGAVVRVETKRGKIYCGRLVGYEKTTGGQVDAIRLKEAVKLDKDQYRSHALYLNWCEVAEMSILETTSPLWRIAVDESVAQ